MNTVATTQRHTKYCRAIEVLLASMGHATNSEILIDLRKTYSHVSATTVHRATSRLATRSSIALAPPSHDGSMRYDSNISPHDHFICTSCGMLRDADIKNKIIPILESSMDDCHISGRLTISGLCKKCKQDI
jgi:Fur family peroxide stress response transcriptional regulator